MIGHGEDAAPVGQEQQVRLDNLRGYGCVHKSTVAEDLICPPHLLANALVNK